ncbi:hypothetical protein [Egbenema bharatensis]|uniref:hypothetical protein n=1 Tax=Egbenema bharatensis TaxID=3463334 RepID=UPI003A896336
MNTEFDYEFNKGKTGVKTQEIREELLAESEKILRFLYSTKEGVTFPGYNSINTQAMSKGYCWLRSYYGQVIVQPANTVKRVMENRMKLNRGKTFRGIRLKPGLNFPKDHDELELLLTQNPLFSVPATRIDRWLRKTG